MVPCGAGEQPGKWLGMVAVTRYDSSYGVELGMFKSRVCCSFVSGLPKALRTETTVLDFEAPLVSQLSDGQHVWVLLRGEQGLRRSLRSNVFADDDFPPDFPGQAKA